MVHPFIFYSLTLSLGYTWLEVHSSPILDKVKKLTGLLSGKHKRILKRNFPFYSKLSPTLLRHFEQKVEFYFYKKKFLHSDGEFADDMKKLLISAYAAQLTFGLKDFYFTKFKKVIIHEDQFFSIKANKLVSWEISTDGVITLSWKIFYSELRRRGTATPLGLLIMANALRMEKYISIKDQIYFHNASTFMENSKGVSRSENRKIFEEKDMQNQEDFFIACLIHYFSKPLELKNRYPDLFKKIDYTLFSKVS